MGVFTPNITTNSFITKNTEGDHLTKEIYEAEKTEASPLIEKDLAYEATAKKYLKISYIIEAVLMILGIALIVSMIACTIFAAKHHIITRGMAQKIIMCAALGVWGGFGLSLVVLSLALPSIVDFARKKYLANNAKAEPFQTIQTTSKECDETMLSNDLRDKS